MVRGLLTYFSVDVVLGTSRFVLSGFMSALLDYKYTFLTYITLVN